MKIKQTAQCLALVMLGLPAMLSFSQEIPVTTSSKEAKKLFLQGRDKFENAEMIPATELLDKAIALDPNFALALLYRSESGGSSSKQLREKAVSLADKVSEGERCQIQYVQADVDGNQEKRKELMEKLVKLFPNDKRVCLWNGFYQNSQKKYEEALASFKKSSGIDKNYGPALNLLGYAYMRTKNWKESENAFKRYAEVLPGAPNPLDSYAEMLMKAGRFDDAITNFKKAISVSPTFISAYTGMGTSYMYKGDFAGARDCFKQQMEKAPSVNWKLTALRNTMLSYLHEGLTADALKQWGEIQTLARSEKLDQVVINSFGNMGWINLMNGNLTEAAKNFEQARMQTEMSNLTANEKQFNKLARSIERVHLLMQVKEYDLAESLLQDCWKIVELRKNPDEISGYYVNTGMFESSRGNYDKALEAFSKVNPEDPFGQYQKAITLELKGDTQGARKIYDEVANWNGFGWIWYAFVRNKAKQKMSANMASGN